MDHKYLKESQYNWNKDPRHLKVERNGIMMIPDGRCLHCGRIFLNAANAIVFCKLCDCAMSTSKEGPEHDYDSFGNKIKVKDLANSTEKEKKIKTIILTAQREIRTPIDFDKEHLYFDKNNKTAGGDEPHFVTASGRIIATEEEETEDEYDDPRYKLR